MMDKIKSKYPEFIIARRARLLSYYPMMKTILTTYSTGDELPFSIETEKEKKYLDLLEKIITLELKELTDFIQENS